MNEHLSGKVAIITGGMNGIGKVCAATLLSAGADVVIADLDTTLAETVITEISTDTERQVLFCKYVSKRRSFYDY